ncbi:MAG TPA: Na+/H+ antiporter NhaA, partial [Actinomycetota bacterium]|nr:Na+/H+ antiporter NhaA [Actinomycetota bacterium]
PWSRSDRPVPRRIVRPLQEFLSTTTASGTMLLFAAVIALAWANSPWGDAYERFWSTPAELRLGTWAIGDDLRHWVNDGLMTLFFLVVGLEIKREFQTGELQDRRAAALPVVAAAGGMIVPALIYLALNAGGRGSSGWGIPMATDIAFALGVLVLAARHAPAGLKPFILTLAIVDDIGAILVIALFYAGGVSLWFLAAAAALCGLMLLLRRAGVRATSAFVGLGSLVWLATYESGVHPAIAGVVLGLLAPAESYQRPRAVSAEARRTADQTMDDPEPPDADAGQWLRLASLSREAVSPLARTEHALLPWTSFVIIPLFALANAGVRLSGEQVSAASTSRVTLGVVLGLVIGKVVGVSGAAALAVALRVARFPTGVRLAHLIGASAVAGIGFTVSLFIAELAFDDEPLITEAKVGILAASVLAGALGWIVLRLSPSAEDASIGDAGNGETRDPSGH